MVSRNRVRKAVFVLVVVVVSATAGYRFGFQKASKVNQSYREQIVTETLENNPAPQCNFGKCPKYDLFDADGDGNDESVATEYTSMSQFAGRILIIKENKVVFVSPEKMFIGVKPIKDNQDEVNNGFIIYYSKVPNASSNDDILWDHYHFVNGKYELMETTSADPKYQFD